MQEFIRYVWSFYGTKKVLSIPGLTIEHVIDAVKELAKRDKNFDGSIDSIDRENVKWILLDKLKLPMNVELGSDFDEMAMYEEDENLLKGCDCGLETELTGLINELRLLNERD